MATAKAICAWTCLSLRCPISFLYAFFFLNLCNIENAAFWLVIPSDFASGREAFQSKLYYSFNWL